MQATRQHILDYLAQNNSASAKEFSLTFGMTVANIRHHLNELCDQGYIIKWAGQKSVGRGRPEFQFSLTANKNQPALLLLAQSLLSQIEKSEISKYPATRIKKLAKSLIGPIKAKSSLSQRLVNIMQGLSQLDYRPAWEATSRGPEIIFNQCPYIEIIEGHPELCRMDISALEYGLDEKIIHLEKLVINSEGHRLCRFSIKN